MVGAAMFFPDDAFAEKNELPPQKGQAAPASVNSNKEAAVSINIPVKAEQAKLREHTIPEHALENQAEAKQKQLSSQDTPSQAAVKDLPEQANGNVKQEIKKAEEEVKLTGNENAAAVQANHIEIKDTSSSKPSTPSIPVTTPEVKPEKVQPVKLVSTDDSKEVLTKSDSIVQEPQKVPASKDEIPKVDQMMNQTQRTNSSGGQSNDRVSQGLSNGSMLDKWFEWNHYFEIKPVQPYLSRLALMNTQWVNAPPAPPPQKAPLLTNVTRS
jgi:hypothetical protein